MAAQLNVPFQILISKIRSCETHMSDNFLNFQYGILSLRKGCKLKEKWLWKEFHKPLKEKLHNTASNRKLKEARHENNALSYL